MKELPHSRSCFVCGESNPLGLRLRFETDGRIVRGRFCPRPEHAGFKGVVHGGLVAAVLDEVMAWTCAAIAGRFAYSVEMTVRFRRPFVPGETVLLTGELAANRKDRIYETRAAAQNDSGDILATATAKFIPVSAAALAEMAGELVGDSSWLGSLKPEPTLRQGD